MAMNFCGIYNQTVKITSGISVELKQNSWSIKQSCQCTKPKSFYFPCENYAVWILKDLLKLFVKSIVDLAATLKKKKNRMPVFREWAKKKFDNSNKIKEQHLNKGKLHLNKKGVKVVSYIFDKKILDDLKWEVCTVWRMQIQKW